MASKTLIANMSLAHCGVTSRIGDVDTENTNEAINVRLFFEHCRDLILTSRPWPFANQQFILQNLGVPPDEWAFRYKFPTNCSLAQFIVNPGVRTPGTDQSIPFKVAKLTDGYGKVILCDQDGAILEGNVLVDDVTLWDAPATQALALCIGAHIAMPLRVDPKIVSYVQNQFSNWLAEASSHAMREGKEDKEPQSQFQTARA